MVKSQLVAGFGFAVLGFVLLGFDLNLCMDISVQIELLN